MRFFTSRSTRSAHRNQFVALLAGLLAVSSVLVAFATPVSAVGAPTIASDQADYPMGSVVTLSGASWQAGEQVAIVVNDTIGQTWQHNVSVTAAADGTVTDVFTLPNYFVSDYDVTATGPVSGVATTTFTDANESASLDQCANDPAPSSPADGCSASATDWVNGNLGASKSFYREGDSIPYRMTFDNLSTTGSHTVTIEWDTTKGGTHAIDYLTTYNQSVLTANPCLGVSGCSGAGTPFAIGADPQVTGAGVTPIAGNFTMFGGTITGVGPYSYANGSGFAGDKSARVTLTFSAAVKNPVLAWGGHISTRSDWGPLGSAVAIPGSPYHTRLIDLDGSGGNQDRSLSAEAVVFPGSITIIKQATPEGATVFPFTASPTPLTNFSLVDDGTAANTKVFSITNNADFKSYTVVETPIPSGWSLNNIVCNITSPNGGSTSTDVPTGTATINLKEGENATCTYTNQRQAAHLIVIKHVINDNGGTAVASDFTMTINQVTADGGNVFPGAESPGTDKTLSTVGAYNVTEAGPSGYAETDSADCTGTIAFGQTKTCTITNNDIAPKLHLRKIVTNDNGGTATVADFTLTADGTGTNDLSGTSPVDSGATLKADTWTLSETTVAGYAAGAWVCVGGTQGDATHITVGIAGEATCTITNNDQTSHLTLVKTVTNDNGGTALTTDFTLSAAGPTPISGAGGADSDVNPGTYTLSETNLPGYTAGSWSCVGGTQGDATHITLALNQSATCTINNDDIAPKLHLRKIVVNDNGGIATVANFTLTANGAGTNDLSGTSPVDSGATLKADTWALSETNVAGYSNAGWVCVGGTQSGSNITVGLDGEATCTITNNDIPPQLHLRKVVVNDNGGIATVADFTLTADGTGTNDLSGTSPVDSGATLQADTWALSETSPSTYSASAWVCVGGTQNGSNITVGIGGSATCTITNNDIPPQLHLRKIVVNDNGGIATVANFTLTANGAGTNDLSGTSPVDSGATLQADTWALSETSPSTYSASAWVCVGGTQNGSNITVGIGGSATCTITNNDIPPQLHLRKIVVNDNGGIATVANFTLTANGAGTNDLSGTSPVDSGATLQADTWALSETNVAGYTASSWVCVGGTQNGSNITVGIGGSATCTITNDDQAAKLIVIKHVVNDNGGTAVAADFTMNVTGSSPNPASFAGVESPGTDVAISPGGYSVSEIGLPGYAETDSADCSGTIALGETKTCTITNDDIAPKLHLRKIVVNDNGGIATVANFTLTANGAGTNDLSGISPVDSGATLKADTWALSETNVAGYSNAGWVCVGGTQSGSNITVGLDGEATCTITNNDIPPQLHLRKVVVNDNGGIATVADFTLTADGTGTNDLSGTSPVDSGATLQADTWALSETSPSTYSASAWVCVGGTQNGSNITVGIGGSATCTITNNDIPPQLHLRKVVVNDNGGIATVANFTLTANGAGTNDLSGTSPVDSGATLQADTWALSETSPSTYSASAWVCVGGTQNGSNITVGIGGSATCTITNNDIPPKLHLRKIVVNDNGGIATVADFTLTADGAGTNDLSGTSPVDSGATLQADTWALSETSPSTYSASAWVCVGGTQNGSNITVGIGGEATCTITNDDIPAHLIVIKHVVNDNGGTAVASDFTMTIEQVTASGGNSFAGAESPGTNKTLLTVGAYNVSENGPSGYAETDSADCSGTIALGQTKTCTITNDDIAPKLHLRKIVVNDNGGTKTVADFTLTANGTGTNDLSGTSPVDSDGTLKADTWALSENSVYGYTASAWVCVGGTQNGSNITVGLDGEATCTITNDDQPGTIVVIKNAKPATGTFTFLTTGTGYNGFTLNGDPANNGNKNTQTLNAGSYTVKESTQLGWILTGIGGSSDPNTPYNCVVTGSGGSTGLGDLNTQTATISLKNGDTVTCTFENTGSGVTRTQGFWATHTPLANIAWFGGTAFGHTFPGVANTPGIGDTLLCGRSIDTLGKLMGGFWSNIAKTSLGKKRSALDQARMQLLQQLLAAELNASAFGAVPAGGSGQFAIWEAAFCGLNQGAIQNALQGAASFNNSGDGQQFTPGTSADSKNARAIADNAFWDVLPAG